tara:strand:- start:107 stop:334 length:228 start_codon:yes stop_codon:yes gene_type:complete
MSKIMENKEFVKTLGKEEVFDMWVATSDRNKKLIDENYRLKKEAEHWRKESDKFQRFWNSTKVDEDKPKVDIYNA